MTALTLDNLIAETDDFDVDGLRWGLDHPIESQQLIDYGIDVIDWNVIGSKDGRQIGVLFAKAGKRYGYYSDNGETVVVELDVDYQKLSDWGNYWDECPDVLV